MNFLFIAPVEKLGNYFIYYKTVCDSLTSKKFTILDDWISQVDTHNGYILKDLDARAGVFYESYRDRLKLADFIIFDTSVRSRTVHYQIAMALFAEKPTLCIRKDDGSGISGILTKIKDKNLVIKEYHDVSSLEEIIASYIENIPTKEN